MTAVVPPDKVSVIVPTFEERDNIAPLVAALSGALSTSDYEIIFVDDSSPDGTQQEIAVAMAANARVRLIVRAERGQGGAIIRGFDAATGNILGTINADLSHDPAIIPSLVQSIVDGADLAIGSRRIKGGGFRQWPWHRRFASYGVTVLTRFALHLAVRDPMSGFYFLRRTVYERARGQLSCAGFKFMLNLIIVAKPNPIVETPYIFKNRQHGRSKVSLKVATQFLEMLWRLRGTLSRNT